MVLQIHRIHRYTELLQFCIIGPPSTPSNTSRLTFNLLLKKIQHPSRLSPSSRIKPCILLIVHYKSSRLEKERIKRGTPILSCLSLFTALSLVCTFPTTSCDTGVYLKWQITKPLRSESAFHAEKTKFHMSPIYKFWCGERLQE